MAEDIRKQLRNLTLGGNDALKSKTVEWNDNKFEIRQPTVALRAKIMKKSQVKSDDADFVDTEDFMSRIDYAQMQVWSVIYCTFVPGTNERVFEEQDAKVLMNKPTGSFIDEFSEVATQLMNVQPEKDAKN